MSRVASRPAVAVQRAMLVSALAGATAVSWTYLVSARLRAADHRPRPAAADLAMWIAMMLAMMLPAAAPMCVTYVRVATRDGQRHLAAIAAFVGTYLALWISVSALAGWTQHLAAASAPLLRFSSSGRAAISAAVLIAAGVYQFTPLKHACLRRCRTPLGFLLGEWRPGASGALRLGLLHGRDCIVCCWTMVALMFVVGTMNLAWMAALTLLMVAEKCTPAGHGIARVTGAAIVAWGVWQLI